MRPQDAHPITIRRHLGRLGRQTRPVRQDAACIDAVLLRENRRDTVDSSRWSCSGGGPSPIDGPGSLGQALGETQDQGEVVMASAAWRAVARAQFQRHVPAAVA